MKRVKSRAAFADSFSRGLDLFRLQLLVQGRSLSILLKTILVVCVTGVSVYTWYLTPEAILRAAGLWAFSWLIHDAAGMEITGIRVDTQAGPQLWTTSMIRVDVWHFEAWRTAFNRFVVAGLVTLTAAPLLFSGAAWLAAIRGRNATADLLSRGQDAVSESELARLVRRRERISSFRIGTVPVPEHALNRNILVLGTTQVGKSVTLKRLLDEIDRRGDMAIIFDKVGDFTERFYDPDRGDVLLNPLDSRAPNWSPWSEMRETADGMRLARSLIPSVNGDNQFFHAAAQDLFAALLSRVGRQPGRTVEDLLRAALLHDKGEKLALLRGTSAAKHFDGDHRSGHDVDATMAVFTQSLRFLDRRAGGTDDFSVRDFITDTVVAIEHRENLAAIEGRLAKEWTQVKEARERLRSGDLTGAYRNYEKLSGSLPLVPASVPEKEEREDFLCWWASHAPAIEEHWERQDREYPESVRRALRDHANAARRIRDNGAPWLFIASNQRQLPALRPLLSLWLDAVADTILSLTPNRNRRIWLVMDEVQALQALPSLPGLLTECAKYGACVCVGLQNMGQLRAAYGRDTAETVLSLFNTKAFFRMPEPDTARWIESAIGNHVIEHVHEGIRYGTSKTMDGAQLSVGRATEPIVLASDIMRMPDLECVLMLPGNWPVGRVRLRFDKRRDAPAPKAQGLIPKPAEETVFHALDQAGWQPLAEGTERMNAEDIAREAAARAPDTEQVQRAPGRDPGAGEATPRPGKKMAVKPLRSRPGRARPASAQIDLGLGHPDDDRGQPRR